MSTTPCQNEPKILAAAQSGDWSQSLRDHMAVCAECRETAQLAQAMNRLAEQSEALMPPAIDPSLLWLKARLSMPRQEKKASPWLIPALALLSGTVAFIGYRMLTAIPAGSEGIPAPVPGSPFPMDATFVVLIVAVALVLWLPSTGNIRLSKKAPGKLIAL